MAYDPYDPASLDGARSGRRREPRSDAPGANGANLDHLSPSHEEEASQGGGGRMLGGAAPRRRGGAPGVGASSRHHSGDDLLRAKAAIVEARVTALTDLFDRGTSTGWLTGDDAGGSVALKAKLLSSEGGRAGHPGREASGEDDTKDPSQHPSQTTSSTYHEADVYIKRAAAGLAGHKKWYASSNRSASRGVAEALEDLRHASLVLQQRHGEEAARSEALALAELKRAMSTTLLQLRRRLEPEVAAIADALEDLKTCAATATTTPPGATAVGVAGVESTRRRNTPTATDEVYAELRLAREAADDAALALVRSQAASQREQTSLLDEIRTLRESLARDGAALLVARAESDKWRAMYDAAKGHAGRDDAARAEVDALRLAVSHSEDRHRRELMLLGTEHGNAYASLKRSLIAAERRAADLEPALEAAEARSRSREDQYREERTARLDLEEALSEARRQTEKALSEARRQTEKALSDEGRARERADAAEEAARTEMARANAWARWRLAAALVSDGARVDSETKADAAGSTWRLAAARAARAEGEVRAAALEEEARTLREELAVARAAVAASQSRADADDPAARVMAAADVAAAAAEAARLEDLARQARDALAHEKEMRGAAEEDAAAAREDAARVREDLARSLERIARVEEELVSATRLEAPAEASEGEREDAKKEEEKIAPTEAAHPSEAGHRREAPPPAAASPVQPRTSGASTSALPPRPHSPEGSNNSTPPISPAYGKQVEALKKRVQQLEGELVKANERADDAARADAAKEHSSPPSRSRSPPQSTIADWNGTEASAAEFYQYKYSAASDNLAVLALLIQEVVQGHYWPGAASRGLLEYGQPHGPMARFAGKLAIRMLPPRIVAILWWEYLMLVCGAWFASVVGIAYFHGVLLADYPAVVLTPFIPSVIALVARLCYTLPLDPSDGARFVLNAVHVLGVPLSYVLLFLKMWNDAGNLPWWLVLVLPAVVLSRAAVEQLWGVTVMIPHTEYNRLGYGAVGSAFEYAFSEPENDEVEIVEKVPTTRRSPAKQKASRPERMSSASDRRIGGRKRSVDNAV